MEMMDFGGADTAPGEILRPGTWKRNDMKPGHRQWRSRRERHERHQLVSFPCWQPIPPVI